MLCSSAPLMLSALVERRMRRWTWQLVELASVLTTLAFTLADARRFFDALLRDVVNALQNLNALEALGPVACAFARQVHPPVHLQQQAPHLLRAQRSTAQCCDDGGLRLQRCSPLPSLRAASGASGARRRRRRRLRSSSRRHSNMSSRAAITVSNSHNTTSNNRSARRARRRRSRPRDRSWLASLPSSRAPASVVESESASRATPLPDSRRPAPYPAS